MTRSLARTTTEQATWAVLLAAVSAISSSVFACVTPFAAFAVAAAYVLPPRAAAAAAGGIWLANQAVGFGYLHYPWDQNTILWGFAIGAAAIVATVLASMVLREMRYGIVASTGAALLIAFAAYEVTLFLVALVLGGEDGFTPAILGKLALLNLVWTIGLVALAEGVRFAGITGFTAGRDRRHAA
jgi:hypothetical protein